MSCLANSCLQKWQTFWRDFRPLEFFLNVLEYQNGSKFARGPNSTYSSILVKKIGGQKKSGIPYFQAPIFEIVAIEISNGNLVLMSMKIANFFVIFGQNNVLYIFIEFQSDRIRPHESPKIGRNGAHRLNFIFFCQFWAVSTWPVHIHMICNISYVT